MRRKVRSDAVLLNLSEERQEQIIEWCNTPKSESCVGGYKFARQQLAADGVKVSERAVSDFYSDWHLRQDIALARRMEEEVDGTPESVQRARKRAEKLLLDLSIVRQDPKLFTAATMAADMARNLDLQELSGKTKAEIAKIRLAQKDRDFALAREKFVTESCEKILKAARDPKMREVAESSTLSNAEKIAAIRKEYFADIDAVEVELPE